tara:strand:+ start:47 stop:283 length:237 start_codon:yes stop_codon:yes gene_type:complete
MGCFKKLYDKNHIEPDENWNGWTNNVWDKNDYYAEIDEGYLTTKQLYEYNVLLKLFKNELIDCEIWSMTNSNNNIEEL